MIIEVLHVLLGAIVSLSALRDDPVVKLDPVPAGLPPAVESEFAARREQLRQLGQKMNAAMDAFDARCARVREGESAYKPCLDEKRELECGFAEANLIRLEFNLDIEAAARTAGVATYLTLTDIAIEGVVSFSAGDGTAISADGRAAVRVPLGTKITTGPTGRLRAGIPGGHPFEVGGGAQLTLDRTFLNPRVTDKVDVNLTNGFFRWLRESINDSQLKGGKYRVRRQGTCAVRG